MLKEISIGLSIALVISMIIMGYDVTPFLFFLAAGGGLYYIARMRGMVGAKNFNSPVGAGRYEISFSDIGGQFSAIHELREALDFIKNHQSIKSLGIRPLKGILLTGPPGTGKTLMAKAAASYTDAVFIAASGSEFIEMYAGVGAQRVRKLFQTARDCAPRQKKNYALIFIDEIEILGGKRGQTTSHLEYDQTLNQLLVEIDGLKVDDNVKVLLVAATNRSDMLDPALMRPGRFDRIVKVDLPDKDGRLEILKIHTRNKPLAEDVELNVIARETFGFSGAHLESLANEAAILAMREKSSVIKQHHFNESIDKVMMGGKLDKRPSEAEMKRIAIHEIGHALISEHVRAGSVSTLTITPRGDALGYMRQTPEDDTYLYTKDYLENQISVMLAGAVAEETILGNHSTGSASDFEQAMRTAETMLRSGMSDLGVICFDSLPQELKHHTLAGIVQEQEKRVKERISEARQVFTNVSEILLEKEKITGKQFRKIIKEYNAGVN
ncbi:AAA family ATPase [Pelotomaculum terephthalicicum JT]|uniref:AAA family ATPase n=1 Tax=Pelotomaculum TaxID=191373 RepID=UPI0009D5692D|nr:MULTISPECIES: AAA family ATPase [Pelotomaculum]MCG9968173.1 AAA family ATPase [Pelotomaculum terephthalicicum JT]OPX83931.1 MAG: ATP-dependent zinc metalloprotease FtsH [Pelotomaculum sp. PtaB.Bin117]OPY63192.1 MAG: ATP-dependent zinc metalloprotease FtsH [Pelotomaculum sp. PtaU1.Bin065]